MIYRKLQVTLIYIRSQCLDTHCLTFVHQLREQADEELFLFLEERPLPDNKQRSKRISATQKQDNQHKDNIETIR